MGTSPIARRIVLALKALVSAGLIVFLVASVDWGRLVREHIEPDWPLLALAIAVYVAQFPLSAYKWQRSLVAHRLEFPYPFLLRVLSIGFFLNNFLPTSIGGDAYRVVRTLPSTGSRSRALSAVVLERAVGFAVLLAVGLLAALVLLRGSPPPLIVYFATLVGSGFATLATLAVLVRLGHLTALWERALSSPKMRVLTECAALIARSGRSVAALVFWSIVFQVLAVLAVYALFAGVGRPVDVATCAVVGAISVLVAVLPVSVNGIGVAEGSFVAAAVELGVELHHAVLVALLSRVLIVLLSVACGLVYLWEIRASARGRDTGPSVDDVHRSATSSETDAG